VGIFPKARKKDNEGGHLAAQQRSNNPISAVIVLAWGVPAKKYEEGPIPLSKGEQRLQNAVLEYYLLDKA